MFLCALVFFKGSSDEIMDQCGTEASTQTKPQSQRSNTTVHVCWHRSTSISMKDELISVEVSTLQSTRLIYESTLRLITLTIEVNRLLVLVR